MDRSTSEAAPIACMLRAGDFKQRLAWIADLNRLSLISARREDLRLELRYVPRAQEAVRELVRRERECCAFLDFDLRIEDDAVRLVVTAPETAREAVDLVFEPFRSKSPIAEKASCDCASGCAL
jgi:hypothetical protein